MPASAAAAASLGPTPPSASIEAPRMLGRGQWTGAPSRSDRESSAAPAKERIRWHLREREALLGGEQPPPARLASLVSLDLDPVGHVGVDLRERDRRALAGDHGDDLGAAGEMLDRR